MIDHVTERRSRFEADLGAQYEGFELVTGDQINALKATANQASDKLTHAAESIADVASTLNKGADDVVDVLNTTNIGLNTVVGIVQTGIELCEEVIDCWTN